MCVCMCVCVRARAMVHLQIEADAGARLLRESRNVDGWGLFERERERARLSVY